MLTLVLQSLGCPESHFTFLSQNNGRLSFTWSLTSEFDKFNVSLSRVVISSNKRLSFAFINSKRLSRQTSIGPGILQIHPSPIYAIIFFFLFWGFESFGLEEGVAFDFHGVPKKTILQNRTVLRRLSISIKTMWLKCELDYERYNAVLENKTEITF